MIVDLGLFLMVATHVEHKDSELLKVLIMTRVSRWILLWLDRAWLQSPDSSKK
jgi:hypothetical protein